MMELWKKIDGFDYEISNMGQVKTINPHLKKFKPHNYGKILTPLKRKKDGYLQVKLCNRGNVKTISIHRLVALYFIPNPENKKEVNHKYGDKTKNTVNDLEWSTPKENTHHSVTNGLKPITCKLSKLDVKFIKYWLKCGYKQKEIALHFNISKVTISDIKRGKSWAYVI